MTSIDIDIDEAIKAAQEIVREAHNEGKLSHLTNRIVRQKVEQYLELEAGTLEEKKYKRRLNETITSTIKSLSNLESGEDKKDVSNAKAGAKEDKDVKPKSTSSFKKPKSEEGTKIEDAKKKNKPKFKSTETARVPGGSKEEGKKCESYKSKETIELDDEEIGYVPDMNLAVESPLSAKSKGKHQVDSDNEDDVLNDDTPRKKRKKTDKLETTRSKKAQTPDSAENEKEINDADQKAKKPDSVSLAPSATTKNRADDGEESDSELSVLLDGPSTKRKKEPSRPKQKKVKGDVKEKQHREKKGAKELSVDEEQIKKLKSLVVACGVRKIWSKELKDCDTPSKQIAHLRGLLTDLGMKGRFSLEQAKAVKEKRELAKEMEDVREFAQKFTGGRPKRLSTADRKSIAGDEGSSDEDGDGKPTEGSSSRRPRNAHRSIMAFLGDQSESD